MRCHAGCRGSCPGGRAPSQAIAGPTGVCGTSAAMRPFSNALKSFSVIARQAACLPEENCAEGVAVLITDPEGYFICWRITAPRGMHPCNAAPRQRCTEDMLWPPEGSPFFPIPIHFQSVKQGPAGVRALWHALCFNDVRSSQEPGDENRLCRLEQSHRAAL